MYSSDSSDGFDSCMWGIQWLHCPAGCAKGCFPQFLLLAIYPENSSNFQSETPMPQASTEGDPHALLACYMSCLLQSCLILSCSKSLNTKKPMCSSSDQIFKVKLQCLKLQLKEIHMLFEYVACLTYCKPVLLWVVEHQTAWGIGVSRQGNLTRVHQG